MEVADHPGQDLTVSGGEGTGPDREAERAEPPQERKRSIEQRAAELLEEAADGEISERDARWIENVYRLSVIRGRLSAARPGGPPFPLLVALLCLLLAGLSLAIRVGDLPIVGFASTNHVSLHVRCRAFETVITGAPDSNIVNFESQIVADRLQVNSLHTVAVSNTDLSIQEATPDLRLDVGADAIYVDELRLAPDASLGVRSFGGSARLSAVAERVRIGASFHHAEFVQPVKQVFRSEEDLGIPLFGRFEFHGDAPGAVDIRLGLQGPLAILSGTKVQALEFVDGYVVGSDMLDHVSTIESGSLAFDDVGRTVDVRNGDRLILQDVDGWITDFSIGNGTVELFFKGAVRELRAGPRGSERDLSPSLLEYVFSNQPFTLFWGAVVFLWGLLNGAVSYYRRG